MRSVKSYSVPCPYCGVLAGQPCRKGLWQMQRAHYTHAARKRAVALAGAGEGQQQ